MNMKKLIPRLLLTIGIVMTTGSTLYIAWNIHPVCGITLTGIYLAAIGAATVE